LLGARFDHAVTAHARLSSDRIADVSAAATIAWVVVGIDLAIVSRVTVAVRAAIEATTPADAERARPHAGGSQVTAADPATPAVLRVRGEVVAFTRAASAGAAPAEAHPRRAHALHVAQGVAPANLAGRARGATVSAVVCGVQSGFATIRKVVIAVCKPDIALE